ncbi:MAG: hypothetical protein ABIR33_08565 [Pyrinomonadaceae bacterium]
MIKHWTPFEGSAYGTKRHRARVTLTRGKMMTFNRRAHEALGKPEAVRFFFDKHLKRIGVMAEKPDSPSAFVMQQRKEYSYRVVRASAFCGHFGIEPEATVAFFDVSVDGEGVMTLDLMSATRLR